MGEKRLGRLGPHGKNGGGETGGLHGRAEGETRHVRVARLQETELGHGREKKSRPSG